MGVVFWFVMCGGTVSRQRKVRMLTGLRFAPRPVEQKIVGQLWLGPRFAPRPAQQATEGQAMQCAGAGPTLQRHAG